jgi:hypothetical protein
MEFCPVKKIDNFLGKQRETKIHIQINGYLERKYLIQLARDEERRKIVTKLCQQ